MPKDTIRHRSRPKSEEEFIGSASADIKEETAPIADLPLAYPSSKIGRPSTKREPTRLKGFHLPLSLIEKIEEEADIVTAGNDTALAIRIFNDYFARKQAHP